MTVKNYFLKNYFLKNYFLKNYSFIISFALVFIGGGTAVYADDSQSVRIFIRTIRASTRIEGEAQQSVSLSNSQREEETPSVSSEPMVLDQELLDLRSKLELLPFKTFRLVSSKEQDISLKKRDLVLLPNYQTLAFRPIYLENKRVGMWINWRDKQGSEILNTRIHFDPNNPVITGTDTSPDSGLILAIRTERMSASR